MTCPTSDYLIAILVGKRRESDYCFGTVSGSSQDSNSSLFDSRARISYACPVMSDIRQSKNTLYYRGWHELLHNGSSLLRGNVLWWLGETGVLPFHATCLQHPNMSQGKNLSQINEWTWSMNLVKCILPRGVLRSLALTHMHKGVSELLTKLDSRLHTSLTMWFGQVIKHLWLPVSSSVAWGQECLPGMW